MNETPQNPKTPKPQNPNVFVANRNLRLYFYFTKMSNTYKVSLNDENDEYQSKKPLLSVENTSGNELNKTADDSLNADIDSLISEGYEFKQSPYRWVICVFFTFNFLARNIAMVGFTAVAKILIANYPINAFHITMLVMPFNFTVLLFLIPYNYISLKFGLRIPTYIAVVCLVIGAWLRLLVNDSFWWVIIGQSIMAVGHPLTLVAPAKIAALWFGDNQRALATMIGSLAGPVGAVLGFLLPFIFLSDQDAHNSPESRDKIRNYILVQSIVVTAIGVPIGFFVKNKPNIAPSISALKSDQSQEESTWSSVKKLA